MKNVQRKYGFLVVLLFTVIIASGCSLFSGESVDEDPNDDPGGGPPLVDLITNGSFEELSGSIPTGYYVSRFSGQGQVVVDETEARTGDRSVRIEGPKEDRTALGAFSTPVEGGQVYRLTVWYRAPEDSVWQEPGSHVYVRVRAQKVTEGQPTVEVPGSWTQFDAPSDVNASASGAILSFEPLRTGAQGDWYPLEVIFKASDEINAIAIDLFNRYGAEPVWFDDLSLVSL